MFQSLFYWILGFSQVLSVEEATNEVSFNPYSIGFWVLVENYEEKSKSMSEFQSLFYWILGFSLTHF